MLSRASKNHLAAMGLTRRHVLAGTGAITGAALIGAFPRRSYARRASDNLFTLGVASGDPWPTSVVLWTRLAPQPDQPGGGMPNNIVTVKWEVARDERFKRIVSKGESVASPQDAHSIHAEAYGLKPQTTYYYRFTALGQQSPVGRTKTAPARDSSLDQFNFAFASCQDYEDGFYTAYDHLIHEDVDLVVFLGDYIYEGAPQPDADVVRPHTGEGEPVTLDEYRIRYALYKADTSLQAAHAAFPWVVTLDDHEVDNDWSADMPQDPDEQPRKQFLQRRAVAFKAYWEHMPLRHFSHPVGPNMQLFRRLTFGHLVEFNVLDTRQYRSLTEPCGFGTGPLSMPVDDTGLTCADIINDPARTILGPRQEHWLLRGLACSSAQWNVLAQQVPITRLDVGAPGDVSEFKLDKWDAYPVARDRLLSFLDVQRPSNPVVITGDLHDNWVAQLKRDFDDPTSATLATEFIGTSISSDGDGAECSEEGMRVLTNERNPHVLFHNWRRGYVVCKITPEMWQTDFRILPFVETPGARIRTRATYVLEDNNPEVIKTAGADNCVDPFAS